MLLHDLSGLLASGPQAAVNEVCRRIGPVPGRLRHSPVRRGELPSVGKGWCCESDFRALTIHNHAVLAPLDFLFFSFAVEEGEDVYSSLSLVSNCKLPYHVP